MKAKRLVSAVGRFLSQLFPVGALAYDVLCRLAAVHALLCLLFPFNGQCLDTASCTDANSGVADDCQAKTMYCSMTDHFILDSPCSCHELATVCRPGRRSFPERMGSQPPDVPQLQTFTNGRAGLPMCVETRSYHFSIASGLVRFSGHCHQLFGPEVGGQRGRSQS